MNRVISTRGDCDKHPVICHKDDDCFDQCTIGSDKLYYCHKQIQTIDKYLTDTTEDTQFKRGVCVSVSAKPSAMNNYKNDNNCAVKFGVLPVLELDPLLKDVYWTCKSTIPWIIDDSGNPRSGVCDGGSITDTNLFIENKIYCKCGDGTELLYYNNKYTNDLGIPRCVKRKDVYEPLIL